MPSNLGRESVLEQNRTSAYRWWMDTVGSLLNWIGGGISRMAAVGLAMGLFMALIGMTPGEAVAYLLDTPPNWLMNDWTRLIVLIAGIVVMVVSLNFNRWSLRQRAIDSLAEDISWAIHELLNRDPSPRTAQEIEQWEQDYRAWRQGVSIKLENRAFFTRADQIHFDRLGFVTPVQMSRLGRLNSLLGQLRLNFERLRDVINWTQQRR